MNWGRLISWLISTLAPPPGSALSVPIRLLSPEINGGAISLPPLDTPRAQLAASYPFAEKRLHTWVAADNREQCHSFPYLSHAPSAKHTFSHSPNLVYTPGFGAFQRKPVHRLALQRIKITKPEQSLLNSLPQQVYQSAQNKGLFIFLHS